MSWTILNEVGIDYAGAPGKGQELRYPVALERALDGSFLIVDEIGLHKNLSVLSECRTLLVNEHGATRFDSVAEGMGDACGTLIDGERLVLLRRTAWELLILGPGWDVEQRLDLSAFTPHLPRLVKATSRGTFLVAALDHVYETDLFEVDDQGRLLWFLGKKDLIGCPTSIQLLDNDHILLADEFGHQALELCRDGSIAWHYGQKRHPSRAAGKLSNPMAITEGANGVRLISDTRNHRILEIKPEGPGTPLSLRSELCSPTFAHRLPTGEMLVCDAGNRRALVIDDEGQTIWQYGDVVSEGRSMSFPRSVEVMDEHTYLVADTCYDRVITLTSNGTGACRGRVTPWPVETSPLFWPRCARTAESGSLIIADGRNSRIIELSESGQLLNELTGFGGGEPRSFKDPHDVRSLSSARLLVTDSSLNAVVEVDWHGRLYWIADADEVGLRDPHSAQQLADGVVLISDSGNGRLVWVDATGSVVREVDSLRHARHRLRLDRPRYAEMNRDGILLIVDSGNNRVLAATSEGELIWELSEVPGSRLTHLSQPRWAQLLNRNEVVVSDHSNHRILHLRHEEDSVGV